MLILKAKSLSLDIQILQAEWQLKLQNFLQLTCIISLKICATFRRTQVSTAFSYHELENNASNWSIDWEDEIIKGLVVSIDLII